jgi:hypothetical protein
MIVRKFSKTLSGFRGTVARIGAAVLVVGLLSAGLASAWLPPSAALAAPGGNGKGNGKGGANGNGGNSGAHDNNGNGAGSGSDSSDADQDTAAGASEGGAVTAEHGGHDFVADEVVVANLGEDARTDVAQLGFVVLDEQQLASLGLTITRLRVPRPMTAPSARTLLVNRYPGVLVDVNALYRQQGQLSLPAPDYPTKLIGWGRAADGCGQDIRIGVLDTAVDTTTPGLSGAHIVQRSFLPAGAVPASTEHGTTIASILVGQHSGGGTGLLPGAELAVASVFGADAKGVPAADVMALVGGLDWLVGSGTRVINMSFAGDANAVVALALHRVTGGRAVVVAAVGNNGPTAPPAFPAAEAGVIGVTAVDNHSEVYADANRGDYVDFAAPGVRIWTPGPASAGSYHTGTSFAVPFVTAAFAVRLAGGAEPDADRLADGLAATAIDLGKPGNDQVFGRGLIQVANPCSQATQ